MTRKVDYRLGMQAAQHVATPEKPFVVAVDGNAIIAEQQHGKARFLTERSRSLAERELERLPYSLQRDAEVVEVTL